MNSYNVSNTLWLNDLRDGRKGIKLFNNKSEMEIKMRERNLNGARYHGSSLGNPNSLG